MDWSYSPLDHVLNHLLIELPMVPSKGGGWSDAPNIDSLCRAGYVLRWWSYCDVLSLEQVTLDVFVLTIVNWVSHIVQPNISLL